MDRTGLKTNLNRHDPKARFKAFDQDLFGIWH